MVRRSLSSGPIALWKADGNTDDSVSGRNGTARGNVSFAPGRSGSAFHFHTNPGGEVRIPGRTFPVLHEFTVDFWLNPDVTIDSSLATARFAWSRGDFRSWMAFENRSGRLEVRLPNGESLRSARSVWPAGEWRRITLTYDGSTHVLYVDGVAEAELATDRGFLANDNDIVFGHMLPGFGDVTPRLAFEGKMDEIAIYDGIPPPPSPSPGGPLALWRGDGDASDSVGSAEGELRGGAGFWPPEGPATAFLLDGLDDHVHVGQTVPAPLAFTVTFRFRAARDLAGVGGTKLFLGRGFSGSIGHDERGRLEVHAGQATVLTTARSDWRGDQWYRVALTFDGVAYVLYVDGVQEGNGVGGNLLANNNDFTIGAPAFGFAGALDDVAIYDRVLSNEEIVSPGDGGADADAAPAPPDAGTDTAPAVDAGLPGLIALWPGNGDATDAVGSAHGQLAGGAGFWPPGGPATAFLFDGLDDHVRLRLSAPAPSRFTLTFRFRPQEDLAVVRRTRMFFGRGLGSSIGHDERGRLEVHAGWGTVLLSARSDWRAGEWYQAVLTFDGFSYALYVDGVREGTGDGVDMLGNDRDFTIGAPSDGFAGAVDEVALYDRVLSASEIGIPVDASVGDGPTGPDGGAPPTDGAADGVPPIGPQCPPVGGGTSHPPFLSDDWIDVNNIIRDDAVHGSTIHPRATGAWQAARVVLSTFSSIRVRVDLKMFSDYVARDFPTAYVAIHVGCAPKYDQVLIGRHVFQPGPAPAPGFPRDLSQPVFVDNPALNGSSVATMGTWVSYTSDDFKHLLPPDTQFLRVTIGSDTGFARFDNIKLVVNDDAVPDVSFAVTPMGGPNPLTAQFQGSCSDPGGSCVAVWWDFGDSSNHGLEGSSSTELSPAFMYRFADRHGGFVVPYDVSFTAEDNKGAARTFVRSINVTPRPPPVVSITATPDFGPAPLPVQFMGSATGTFGMLTYDWSFGDGIRSNEQNPSHTFIAPGNYQVTLTVQDELPSLSSSTRTIVVHQ